MWLSVRNADRALTELEKVGIQGDKSLGRLPPAADREQELARFARSDTRGPGSTQRFTVGTRPAGAALSALSGLAAAESAALRRRTGRHWVHTVGLALKRFSRRVAELAQDQGGLREVAEQYGVRLRHNAGQIRGNSDS